jgi:hypothetical protein
MNKVLAEALVESLAMELGEAHLHYMTVLRVLSECLPYVPEDVRKRIVHLIDTDLCRWMLQR